MFLYVTVNYQVFTSRYFQLSVDGLVGPVAGYRLFSKEGGSLRVKRPEG